MAFPHVPLHVALFGLTLVANMGKVFFFIFPPQCKILAINLKFLHGHRLGQILGLSLPKVK